LGYIFSSLLRAEYVGRSGRSDLTFLPTSELYTLWAWQERWRGRVVVAFPDGQSVLNLTAARLRHIAGTAWSTKRYLNIESLKYRMRGDISA